MHQVTSLRIHRTNSTCCNMYNRFWTIKINVYHDFGQVEGTPMSSIEIEQIQARVGNWANALLMFICPLTIHFFLQSSLNCAAVVGQLRSQC